jgi:nicotinamidase-related amidase
MKKLFLLVFASIMVLGANAQNKESINNKVLVVLDIQKVYTTTVMPDSASSRLIENTNKIIELFNPDKVVYIKSLVRVLDVSFKGFKVDTLPNLEIDNRLKIVSDNIFWKTEGDAFTSKEFSEFIKKQNFKEFIVVGLLAERCVTNTLLGGNKLGYSMYYVPEAVVAKSQDKMQKTQKKLQKNNVKAISLNQIEQGND